MPSAQVAQRAPDAAPAPSSSRFMEAGPGVVDPRPAPSGHLAAPQSQQAPNTPRAIKGSNAATVSVGIVPQLAVRNRPGYDDRQKGDRSVKRDRYDELAAGQDPGPTDRD